jgi:hypothetical protein
MQLPEIQRVVEHRLLINYRVAPDVAARLLPQPFRPQLVRGWAVASRKRKEALVTNPWVPEA